MAIGSYPSTRLRRTRQAAFIRDMVRETRLVPAQLIQPLFVAENALRGPVAAMPGVTRLDLDELVRECEALYALGIRSVALFPVTPAERKTPNGDEALNPDSLMCRAIKAVKQALPQIGIVADVALDPYTSHGQDGVLDEAGRVDNDASCEILRRQAAGLRNIRRWRNRPRLVAARARCQQQRPRQDRKYLPHGLVSILFTDRV